MLNEFWPFTVTDCELANAVADAVPRYIDPLKRAEICQSLCLMILDGSLLASDINGPFYLILQKMRRVWREDRRRPHYYFTFEDLVEQWERAKSA